MSGEESRPRTENFYDESTRAIFSSAAEASINAAYDNFWDKNGRSKHLLFKMIMMNDILKNLDLQNSLDLFLANEHPNLKLGTDKKKEVLAKLKEAKNYVNESERQKF